MAIILAYVFVDGLLTLALIVQMIWQYFSPREQERRQAEIIWLKDFKK